MNWHYGFAAAGVGMVFGLIQFRLTRARLGNAGRAPATEPSQRLRRTAWSVVGAVLAIALLLLLATLGGWLVLDAPALARGTAVALVAAMIVYFAYVFLAGKLTPVERNRVIVIVVLVLACSMFWAGFEQAGSSLNLFARYTAARLRGLRDARELAAVVQSHVHHPARAGLCDVLGVARRAATSSPRHPRSSRSA